MILNTSVHPGNERKRVLLVVVWGQAAMSGVRTKSESNSSIAMSSNEEEKPSLTNTGSASAASNNNTNSDDVEIIVRPDGKKVRRVRKTVTRAASSASLPAVSSSSSTNNNDASEIYIRPDGKKVRRVRRQASAAITPTPLAALGTSSTIQNSAAAPTSSTTSEVYINADGKKVRRVVKKKAPPSAAEGDIYVRPDGKKVRRVRRSVSSSSAAVSSSSDDESALGEIYINKDGKKVRRVRKPKGTAAASSASTGESPTPVGDGQIYINKDGKRVRRVVRRSQSSDAMDTGNTNSALGKLLGSAKNDGAKRSGAATVAGDATGMGEIYINAQGKRVRRVRRPKRTTGAAATTAGGSLSDSNVPNQRQQGEVYINADGKKVRRVIRRSKSNDSGSLGSLLAGSASSSKPGASGSATVAGSDVEKGEIYIRADGKKVRRVRKPKAKQPTALEGFISDTSDNKPAARHSGSATVGGDRKLDGEIIIRPDGKKVIRRPKSKSGSDSSGSEIYRRADGKLVRRVRRSQSVREANSKNNAKGPPSTQSPAAAKTIQLSKEEEDIAADYRKMRKMGLPDDAVRHKMNVSNVHGKIIAAVLGEEWKEGEEDSKPAATPTKDNESPTVQLSAEEEEIASTYRKMQRMGLPDDAVRHKMAVSDVHPKIIAAVFREAYVEDDTSKGTAAAAAFVSSVQLSEEEDNIADTYRKMMKLGMPEGAVRHKMQANEVNPKIIAAVFNDEWNEPNDTACSAETAQTTDSSQLSAAEQAVADQYKRMIQMGLPVESVRHKMKMGEVDPKIIAAVMDGGEGEPAETPEVSSNLSDEEEEIATQYRKMLKMGLPVDLVRHKMVLNEVDPKVISSVLEGKAQNEAVASAGAGGLSPEQEQTAEHYRKMLKMGLPVDAVRHKMVLAEVEEKIMSAVLDATSSASPETKASGSPGGPNAVAYVVVVGDGDATDIEAADGAAASVADGDFVVKPDEKFAVKVSDEANPASGSKMTKFFTLKELAELSGKNPGDLEAVVLEKRKRGASPPRFSLLPLNEQKFEVSLPPSGTASTTSTPTSSVPPPNAKNVKEVRDGQEVVDSELAQAARAVSALGNGDMAELLEKLKAGDMKDLLEKLHEAEKRQKKLEKQLAQAGVAIAEDIDYSEAKLKVEEIAKRMNEIGGSDVVLADKEEQTRLREEYFKLEQQMERYNTAMMMTEEYQAEQDRIEALWEATNAPQNEAALRKLRRHMPVNIRHLSEADLTTKPSPNGKYLPKAIAKKFKRTNVLQCLRLNPNDIECMHPATLENMRVTGLTLTERRALYAHLLPIGPKWKKNKAEKMTERKWTWYQMMKSNFKESVAPYQRHVEKYGPPENHPYATRENPNAGCPLIGKQCPIRADKVIDYDGDYGWTEEAEFEVSEVRKADVEDSGAKAMAEARELAKEKKANERADILKKHYKGKLLQVSKANGSCESMDEAMDNMENNTMRWIEFIIEKGADDKKELQYFTDSLNEFKLKLLDYAQRSGMQMTGKKTKGGGSADIRSPVEASLAEEVGECSREFFKFIRDRMKELGARDTRITKTMEMLEGILSDLHDRNLAVLKQLGVKRMERSRKLKTNKELRKIVEEKQKPAEDEAQASEETPPQGGGGRGGLMDAISGRGRGGGGRGGLLDGIKGRGRGGGGRGGLLDGIKGRGRGGGGRGGLLDGIKGRGGKPAAAGGRGGLLDAIAARGRGGESGGESGGGRGGLMAASKSTGCPSFLVRLLTVVLQLQLEGTAASDLGAAPALDNARSFEVLTSHKDQAEYRVHSKIKIMENAI